MRRLAVIVNPFEILTISRGHFDIDLQFLATRSQVCNMCAMPKIPSGVFMGPALQHRLRTMTTQCCSADVADWVGIVVIPWGPTWQPPSVPSGAKGRFLCVLFRHATDVGISQLITIPATVIKAFSWGVDGDRPLDPTGSHWCKRAMAREPQSFMVDHLPS